MFVGVIPGKLDIGISTCSFSVNTYVNVIVFLRIVISKKFIVLFPSVDILNWRFSSNLLISSKFVRSFVLF